MKKSSESTIVEFSARIDKTGINPYIQIPPDTSKFFQKRGYIPIKGTLNNIFIRATLVPVKGGAHRLYINGEMRKKANVSLGDTIRLRLEFDTDSRTLPVPNELKAALLHTQGAEEAFNKLAPSHRNEILAYLNSLKRRDSLERNSKKVIDILMKSGKRE